jgi:hypothetical protein
MNKEQLITKSTRLAAFLSSSATLGLYIVLVWFNPYAQGNLTSPTLFAMIISLLSVVLSIAARPLIMIIVGSVLFFPIGFYMLGAPSIFRLIGICNLLYLAAGILLLVSERSIRIANNRINNPNDDTKQLNH